MTRGNGTLSPTVARASNALALFEGTSAALRRVVPFDAAVWQATDPATGLPTAPMRAENLGEDGCETYWDCELLSEEVNLFRDLARAPVPVAALRESTGDEPEHSATFRRFLRPRGLADELRAVLRVDGQWWGQVSLFRERHRDSFTARDVATVAGLSPVLGKRLRSFAVPAPQPVADHAGGPGLLLFDASGALLSINDEARAFLRDLPAGPSAPTRLGIHVPAWVHSTAARALVEDGTRVRARDRAGRWLLFHSSCLRDADGTPTQAAVVVEPAKAADIAPLLTAAYGLTERELEITQLVARGLSTAQLARRLHLSPHTVRDHVKAIFGKTGVTSRGELVARLYTEHLQGSNRAAVVRVWHD
ncbi:LuxR family transcriptional regulator [Saccharothrix sp. NRRL B-16348]|uniref:helix-turn-helix transcriptional regulator n=1 Tax=Saccharothrix sp. NRRL B-16348 TaxID=1415542 RepID=UPI0006AF5842|nr:helix-turn-helix transcriptional regulator [Saccharothrix sp. NRRL B-16348]KOX21534.1 LuxR family transcriptional regulator [Saccharothrix sp. NRRL B-16348]